MLRGNLEVISSSCPSKEAVERLHFAMGRRHPQIIASCQAPASFIAPGEDPIGGKLALRSRLRRRRRAAGRQGLGLLRHGEPSRIRRRRHRALPVPRRSTTADS